MLCLPCQHLRLTAPSFPHCRASVAVYYWTPPQRFQLPTFFFFFNGVLWLKLCKEEKKFPLLQLCSGEYMLYLMTSDNQVKNTIIVTGDVYRRDSDLGLFALWLAHGHHVGRNVSWVMNISQRISYVWGFFFSMIQRQFYQSAGQIIF